MKILKISAMQILDSRGNPTVQVELVLEDGSKGCFRVPSGASTGIYEAYELRDNNKNIYHGKSVMKAVENVEKIKEEFIGKDFNQKSLDAKLIMLDGTKNKKVIGANAILGISVAFAKAAAKFYNVPLYEYLYRLANGVSLNNKTIIKPGEVHLFANVINGGLHAVNSLNFQEFMLVPIFGTLSDKVRATSEVYHILKKLIAEEYGGVNANVGDEGGFAPDIKNPKDALKLLIKAIEKANYVGQVALALDTAASVFYDQERKLYEVEPGVQLNYKELTDYYNDLIENYPIISIEDPMAEDDFEGFAYFTKHVAKINFVNPLTNDKTVLVVGDDLLVTNPERIKVAINKKLCNSLLLKINQIGTLSESIEAFKLANSKKWHTIVSHRSGDTIDDFISDLAVALNSSIKLGAPARGERIAKYNRLLNIFR